MNCDFCYELHPTPAFEYPATDFPTIDGIAMSRGSWLACDECAELIERGDLMAVAIRNIDRTPEVPQDDIELIAELIGMLVQTYTRFQSHRTGPRHAIQLAA